MGGHDMSAFDKIKLGLEEAIAYEKGTLPAKTTRLTIVPVETKSNGFAIALV